VSYITNTADVNALCPCREDVRKRRESISNAITRYRILLQKPLSYIAWPRYAGGMMNMSISHFEEGRPFKGHTVGTFRQIESYIFQYLVPKVTEKKRVRSCDPYWQPRELNIA
jgi:hypothetical protein